MFERFTDDARKVVIQAQNEARMLNHTHIGTEHILLALIQDEGADGEALEMLGVTLEAVRLKVTERTGIGKEKQNDHIPFTPRAKKVLEFSLREALSLGHNHIGTEHILLGLIREGEGSALQILVTMGIDPSRVRRTVIRVLADGLGEPKGISEADEAQLTKPLIGLELEPDQVDQVRSMIAGLDDEIVRLHDRINLQRRLIEDAEQSLSRLEGYGDILRLLVGEQ